MQHGVDMRWRFFLISGLLLLLTGCQKTLQHHGWVGDPKVLEAFKPGVLRAEIENNIGIPALISTFDDHVIYYIHIETEQGISVHKPTIKTYEAWQLIFNDAWKLQSLKRLPPLDGRRIMFLRQVTPSHAQKNSWVQQLFRNFLQAGGKKSL